MRMAALGGAAAALCGIGTVGSAAAAPQFSVVGTAPGYAQIGAFKAGLLYGTLPYNGDGVLFSMAEDGTYTVLHVFKSARDGSAPRAQLAIDGAGNLYGTAGGGGGYSGGTLWEYTAGGRFRTLHSFGAGQDGTVPMQGPTPGSRGAIYGSTAEGAIGGSGNIFSYGRKPGYDVLYDFMSGTDGHCPFSGVAVGKAGTLFGTTVGVGYGGNPNGSVWTFTRSAGLQTLYVFADGADGEWPSQAPTVDNAGDVFGTTNTQNGQQFAGAVWKIDASGHFAVLHSLDGGTDGYAPNSPLVPDGARFFGTTGSGGKEGYGTVFSIGKDGGFNVVHAFAGTQDGQQPTGNLVRGEAAAFYGGVGTGQVFKIVP